MAKTTTTITLKPRTKVHPNTKIEDIEWTLPRSSVPEPLVGRISLDEWETTFDAVEERYRFMLDEFEKLKPWLGLSIFSPLYLPEPDDVYKQSKLRWRSLIRRELDRIYEPVAVQCQLATNGMGVRFTLYIDDDEGDEEPKSKPEDGTRHKRQEKHGSSTSREGRSKPSVLNSSTTNNSGNGDQRDAEPEDHIPMKHSSSFLTEAEASVMSLSEALDNHEELTPQNVFDHLHQLEKLYQNGALNQKQYTRSRERLWRKIAEPKGQSCSYFASDKEHAANLESHLDRLHKLFQTGAITGQQFLRARDKVNQLKTNSERVSQLG